MLSRADNELMCRVEGDAPMGRMLRQHFWLPAARAAGVEADGKPVRVRLLGENFIVWRGTDGRMACFDEGCPHRGVSLALGQNRDCTLTCIFHGWKFGIDGSVIDVPTEGSNSEAFSKTVPLKSYPVREAAGVVWVWLGSGDTPPAFWDLPFMDLPADHFVTVTQKLDANWVQGVEGTIDSSHVGVLHQSWLHQEWAKGMSGAAKATAVDYEFDTKPYGYTASATRHIGNDLKYVRVTEFVLPWFGMIPAENPPFGDRTAIFAAPTDDTHMMQFFIRFNPYKPVNADHSQEDQVGDPDAFAPIGTADEHWGQDRELMKQGHWTGFRQLVAEDFATQVSQGAIADREKEYLSSSDQFVIRVRRGLLQAVREFQAGKVPACAPGGGYDFSKIHARAATIEEARPWREIETPTELPVAG
ncbi:phenylpropionate dioxygenase-like ring-hydroxylating dioxygenase large terminal subunit [Novosphingobium sp. 1529]|uniref:Rieske 2Fe-2S domain-containing protein n=1 Tax=Novosphingobium sp. 1529 TaxID=3156424 RepID=UPI001494F9F2